MSRQITHLTHKQRLSGTIYTQATTRNDTTRVGELGVKFIPVNTIRQ